MLVELSLGVDLAAALTLAFERMMRPEIPVPALAFGGIVVMLTTLLLPVDEQKTLSVPS